ANSATTTFVMPAGEVTAEATYKDIPPQQPTTYTVTVTNGTATPTGPNAAGTNVTITANAAPQGKVFDKWEVIGATVADVNSATTSFTMPANAVTATATYKDVPQQPTATLTDIKITTPPTKTTYTAGESFDPIGMVVTAYYSDQSSRLLSNNEYTYAPAGALTAIDTKITVTYDDGLGTIKTAEQAITVSPPQQPTTYTVTFDSNGGSGTMADVFVESGKDYTLPANGFTAPLGKWFKCWSVGGVEKAVGDKITVAANTTVTAVWAGNTYNPRPNYPIYINPTPGSSSTGQIIAAKTFDGGIGLSVAVTILSAMGGAWLAKKKED
ncbi:MAG: InlB B-repeat-containing protein, partial [Oscillospiraceae bacterium]|nr:InlB B-repeat-containing protein [Oscillospiraceae bacterium]